ncbi:MAG: XRE family transcriptional regulator [Candidatus Viridilinea halotolerans]|uniref:XRE family transcriptional regulator n=1 Tax=Candidatus Viridilinea halotolerans TaxID=2491704 RepID=A0A426U2Q5_9CHLR|nr:MAG: XRE family transcriptional regulator [Candidatus Viridilinea halotolerans]
MHEQPSKLNNAELAVALGRRIARMRLAAGLTLREMAARLGIDHSTLVGYEAGRRSIRVTQLVAIAHALGVAPAALLIEPPEAAALVNRMEGDIEFVLQVSYIVATLDLPDAEP